MIHPYAFAFSVPVLMSGDTAKEWLQGDCLQNFEKGNVRYNGYTIYISSLHSDSPTEMGTRSIIVNGYDNCKFGEFFFETRDSDPGTFIPVLKFRNQLSYVVNCKQPFWANDELTTEVEFKLSNNEYIIDISCLMDAVQKSWEKVVNFIKENRAI